MAAIFRNSTTRFAVGIVFTNRGKPSREEAKTIYIYITVVRREPEATKTLDFMGHRGYELSKNLRFCLGH